MDWPYWVMIVVAVAEARGWLSRKLGRLEGWHEGWDAREAVAVRDAETAAWEPAPPEPAEPEAGAACTHCGEPTGHEGGVCYPCAHVTVGVPELGGEG